MLCKPSILSLCPNLLNKYNYTLTLMLDPQYKLISQRDHVKFPRKLIENNLVSWRKNVYLQGPYNIGLNILQEIMFFWLLCLVSLLGVSWLLRGSSSRCHGFVCSLWLWYFLVILTYYFGPGQSKDPLINAYNSMQSECIYYSNDNAKKFPVHNKVFSTGPCQFNLFVTYTVSPRWKVTELYGVSLCPNWALMQQHLYKGFRQSETNTSLLSYRD